MRPPLAILPALCALMLSGHAAASSRPALPTIPRILFGVNQYNVGPPELLARYWPLTDDDAGYLKSLGCNAVRFPLYPSEVGIDEKRLLTWQPDGRFDPGGLAKPDRCRSRSQAGCQLPSHLWHSQSWLRQPATGVSLALDAHIRRTS